MGPRALGLAIIVSTRRTVLDTPPMGLTIHLPYSGKAGTSTRGRRRNLGTDGPAPVPEPHAHRSGVHHAHLVRVALKVAGNVHKGQRLAEVEGRQGAELVRALATLALRHHIQVFVRFFLPILISKSNASVVVDVRLAAVAADDPDYYTTLSKDRPRVPATMRFIPVQCPPTTSRITCP